MHVLRQLLLKVLDNICVSRTIKLHSYVFVPRLMLMHSQCIAYVESAQVSVPTGSSERVSRDRTHQHPTDRQTNPTGSNINNYE